MPHPIVRKTSKTSKSIFTDKCHQSQSLSSSQTQRCTGVSYLGQTVVQRTALSIALWVTDLNFNCVFLLQIFWSWLWSQQPSGLLTHEFPLHFWLLHCFSWLCPHVLCLILHAQEVTPGIKSFSPDHSRLGEAQRHSDQPELRRLLSLCSCLLNDAIVSVSLSSYQTSLHHWEVQKGGVRDRVRVCVLSNKSLIKTHLKLLPH